MNVSVEVPGPAAILFDMDGTLIETEHLYAIVGRRLVTAAGGSWTQADDEASVGAALDDFAVHLRKSGVKIPERELIRTVVAEVNAAIGASDVWRDGARELLWSVFDSQIPFGLVTMSYRQTVEQVLADSGIPDFPVVVTGDDVDRGKPDPEAYLLAASQLGVDPEECVALEDSSLGLMAARAAGMRRIAVEVPGSPIAPEESLYNEAWKTLVGQSSQDIVEGYMRSYRR